MPTITREKEAPLFTLSDFSGDPTIRTLQQLQREVSALKELHDVRLAGMDKAIQVAHDDLVRVPTDVQKAVGALKDLLQETFKVHNEKFESVQKQFGERDTRTEKIADLSQKALDAALLTAEKAVGKQSEAFAAATAKSEAAFTKQIDGITQLLNTGVKSLDDKIALLNKRMDLKEGQSSGFSAGWGILVAAVGALGVIAMIVVMILK
jgi:hypothetical protein